MQGFPQWMLRHYLRSLYILLLLKMLRAAAGIHSSEVKTFKNSCCQRGTSSTTSLRIRHRTLIGLCTVLSAARRYETLTEVQRPLLSRAARTVHVLHIVQALTPVSIQQLARRTGIYNQLHAADMSSTHRQVLPGVQEVVQAMGWRNNIDTVIEGRLYIGNILAATTPATLSERRITHVVSVCTESIPAHNLQSGFLCYRIPVQDDNAENLLIHLPAAVQWIHSAIGEPDTSGRRPGVVLVHCVQGLSRSAFVVAAYLMWSRRISATDALWQLRQAREQIWLNPALHEQLILYELCQYAPGPNNGIYRSWRAKLEGRIRAGMHVPGTAVGL